MGFSSLGAPGPRGEICAVPRMRISNIQVRRPVGDEEGALLSESLETRSSDCGVFNKVCGTWGRSLEAKLQYVRDVENWNIIFYDGGTSKTA